MRLLVRANSHRPVEAGSLEIAAAPDTPHRERWQWHVRLHDGISGAAGAAVRAVPRGDGTTQTLEVAADPAVARPTMDVLECSATEVVDRSESEVVVLLVTRGAALVEGRHLLAELDALILEGDDPLSLAVDPVDVPLSLAVVRLRPAGNRALAWVP